MKKTIAAVLLASALLPTIASAQTSAPAADGKPAAQTGAMSTQDQGTMNDMNTSTTADASGSPFVTVDPATAWRVSDLEGTNVYGSNGDSIGDIKDVLVDRQGRVTAVLVGVGGFLGLGEKNVAVSMESLDFQTEAGVDNMSTASTSTGTTTGTAATDDDANELDRVVLNVTKEQLEQAPAYANADERTGSVMAPATTDTATPGATTGNTAPSQ